MATAAKVLARGCYRTHIILAKKFKSAEPRTVPSLAEELSINFGPGAPRCSGIKAKTITNLASIITYPSCLAVSSKVALLS
jgi:hypothetical protein